MGEMIGIAARDGGGEFAAYLARPEGAPKTAIVVVQEIFGVNPGIRRKADDWAAKDYLAIARDLFWRFAPGWDAYLTATRTDVDTSAGYYGARIDAYLNEAHAIARPLLLHFAEHDNFIPANARAKIHAALDGSPACDSRLCRSRSRLRDHVGQAPRRRGRRARGCANKAFFASI